MSSSSEPLVSTPRDRPADAAAVRLVSRRLDGLPGRPGGIARLLRARGVRGDRDDSERCPLARHLSPGLPPGYRVQVGAHRVRLRRDDRRRPVSERPLPPRAVEFVAGFDAGHHPALER